MKAKTPLLLSLLIGIFISGYSKDKRPLENKRYRYKELVRRGYTNVQPYKGRIFISFKKYLEINKL